MTDPPEAARQRDVWFVNFDTTVGHEQAGRRPAVVISVDGFSSISSLAIVVPFTRTRFGNPLHFFVEPPEGGLREPSWAMPEMVRSVSRERLVERWGRVRRETLVAIVDRVALLTTIPRQ